MRVAVVGDVRSGRHRLLAHVVRHREAATPGARLRAAGCRLVVELLHGVEHLHQRTLLRGRHRRRRNPGQGLLDRSAALLAAEHLPAHRFHHVLGQDAAHHRELDAARRIVEQTELRLFPVAEKSVPGCLPETLGNDDGNGCLPAPHLVPRFGLRRHRQLEALVRPGAGNDAPRDGAGVLIDDRDRNAGRLAVAARPGKDRSEERRDGDRHHETDDHRAPIAQEELQVLADHREKRDESHQSRKLLPVSVRNTVSSVA